MRSHNCCGIYKIQALAVELEKTEVEDLVEEVCKEVGSGYHVRYFKLMTVSICGRISWINSASDWPASLLQHYACTNSMPGDWARRSEQALEQANATIKGLPSRLSLRLVSAVKFRAKPSLFLVAEANSARRQSGRSWRLLPFKVFIPYFSFCVPFSDCKVL